MMLTNKDIAIVALCVCCAAAEAVGQTHTRERALARGPFAVIEGARLGNPIKFENQIDTHTCFPLVIGGQTDAWLTRAYGVGDGVFVRRCELDDHPSGVVTRGNREGGANAAWERVSVLGGSHVRFIRLKLPRWHFMSNPTFCDSFVAYWGLESQVDSSLLSPRVFDLLAGVQVTARAIGKASLELDDEEYLPRPAWDNNCTRASFDGRGIGKSSVVLTVGK